MYGALDIAVSGMIAQRTRLEVITANIVNKDAVLDARGAINPYRRREALFAPGDPSATTAAGRKFGVHVAEIGLDPTDVQPRVYDPNSPYAYKSGPYQGYVAATNVNPVVEQINQMEAIRAYEANVVAAETTKTMMAQALRLVA
jgi:flagellar basal-body rod protein FlgC